MKSHFYKNRQVMAVAVILTFWTLTSAAQEKPETFVLTVSLPNPTMHVGDDLVLDVLTANPTDHVVYAGQGGRVGLAVELLNEQGVDIGLHAMGIPGGKIQESGAYFTTYRRALKPSSKDRFTWRFKPEPGYLVPGVYKLRVYQRELKSNTDVYSNRVVLTVSP